MKLLARTSSELSSLANTLPMDICGRLARLSFITTGFIPEQDLQMIPACICKLNQGAMACQSPTSDSPQLLEKPQRPSTRVSRAPHRRQRLEELLLPVFVPLQLEGLWRWWLGDRAVLGDGALLRQGTLLGHGAVLLGHGALLLRAGGRGWAVQLCIMGRWRLKTCHSTAFNKGQR